MINTSASHNYLEEYIIKIRSKGRYCFTWAEAKAAFNVSDKALNQSLYRLKAKKRIAQVRKGFYAIIPPEYSNRGMIPVHLFIDDLMHSLNKRYYVGLLSAAALHGAAHQQPMEYFVITEKPALRNIRNKKLKINFYVKKDWLDEDIIQKKTEAGYINVSSPELTALDLFYYQSNFGINKIVTILKELGEVLKVSSLIKTAKN
ncbi:MAG: type IV toxin-antitoxin system AbiEi family antitoxin domain-containing protein, partial [Bacteroidia bacterium]